MEAIDLTQDDDEVYIRPAKRARPSSDSDVEVVEEPGISQATSEGAAKEDQLGDDEDLVVTRQKGQVRESRIGLRPLHHPGTVQNCMPISQAETIWCLKTTHRPSTQVWNQHLPHVRTQCGVHPYQSGKALQNAQHCIQCYCYICDVAATSCKLGVLVRNCLLEPGHRAEYSTC